MAKFIKGDVVVGKNRDIAPIYLPGFQDGTGNGEGAGAAAFGSANFIAGEVAPLHVGEMGADRPVVFGGAAVISIPVMQRGWTQEPVL